MAKRILVIASDPGSLVNFRLRLLQSLKRLGFAVLCAAPSLSRNHKIARTLEEEGFTALDYPLARTGLNPVADLHSLRALVSLCRQHRPSHVLAYTIKPVIYGMLAAGIARVPHRTALITGLGYAFTGKARGKRGLVQRLVRSLYRVALARATTIFFQNPDDASLFRELDILQDDAHDLVVNGSGVDLDDFAPAPLPQGKPLTFLLVARLLTAKGILEFAEAARWLKQEGAQARFWLVGPHDINPDAVDPALLEQWVENGWVEWNGPSDDISRELADCHVFVLPSNYREGTPRSILEALATGRAIITTDAPGCRETVVEGKNGFLVPPRNAKALAEAMQRYVDDPSLSTRHGAASLEIAREKYDVRKVNETMFKAMGLVP